MKENKIKGEDSLNDESGNPFGLPHSLKSAIENLSGLSTDAINVNFNSDKAAQLQAVAYSQAAAIHLAYGQEKHLPHETWHVVKQDQGRVTPNMQMKKGIPINDTIGLEKEADRMAMKALSNKLCEPLISKGSNLARNLKKLKGKKGS